MSQSVGGPSEGAESACLLARSLGVGPLPVLTHALHLVPSSLPSLCSGLHFLAVMPDEEAEICSGIWLLLDRQPPNV